MGRLECTRCGGIAEKPTYQEAADSLDHGIGLTKGRPCPNDGQHLVWNGKPVDPKNPPRSPKTEAITYTTSTQMDVTASGTTATTGMRLTTSGSTPAPKKTKTPAPKKRR